METEAVRLSVIKSRNARETQSYLLQITFKHLNRICLVLPLLDARNRLYTTFELHCLSCTPFSVLKQKYTTGRLLEEIQHRHY